MDRNDMKNACLDAMREHSLERIVLVKEFVRGAALIMAACLGGLILARLYVGW